MRFELADIVWLSLDWPLAPTSLHIKIALRVNDYQVKVSITALKSVSKLKSYKEWNSFADGILDSQGTPVWQRPQP